MNESKEIEKMSSGRRGLSQREFDLEEEHKVSVDLLVLSLENNGKVKN